jgi:cystathionine beta-synthase
MMADSGRAYFSKAFNDDWLRDNNFLPSPMKFTTVEDLIQKRAREMEVISAKVDQNVLEVVNMLKDNGISQVPVFSDEKLVGVLDETDLILPLATGKLKPTEPIIHLIKGSIVMVDPHDNLESLSAHLQKGFMCPW